MITSVGMSSFRGISGWNSRLQQAPHYIVIKPPARFARTPLVWPSSELATSKTREPAKHDDRAVAQLALIHQVECLARIR
jgi:hypothetical protein